VLPQPALSNRVSERRAVLRGRAALLEQELAVDLLNEDAPVLYRIGCVGDLQELARGFSRSASGLSAVSFMRLPVLHMRGVNVRIRTLYIDRSATETATLSAGVLRPRGCRRLPLHYWRYLGRC
jgi:hypothetical protein